MSRQLGTLNVPVWDVLPESGFEGQLILVGNTVYKWQNSLSWVPCWPIFIQDTAPSGVPDQKYLWINTSGTGDATFWVEDGKP